MSQHTLEVTGDTFEAQVLGSSVPFLVEFTADWCPPCKMIAPYMDQIAINYAGKLEVGLLDADENPYLVQTYGVMGLPTLILFVNGEPAERLIGFMPYTKIEARVLPHLQAEQA